MNFIGYLQTLRVVEQGPPNRVVQLLGGVFQFTWLLVVAAIIAIIVLMLARFLLNYADLNPFSRPVIIVRGMTDRFVNPVRRALAGFGINPNGAPLVVILLAVLFGYFVMMLAASLLNTAAGVAVSLSSGQAGGLVALLGYVLYGLLSLYSLLILIRIIFSWAQAGYGNRVMRFLMNATDPVLVPLRRMIPPLGVFDISPIVAFIIIWLFQAAITMTLLRGWPIEFFR